ncbi:MAG: SDR family NAD(P)-dependent oxidoreductase [Muribaculaceae bacterium]|nr:SDR family NAD(P)-dependent oxidoreductase [Muribaculaceae bacterium]MDE6194891.1 SDR family NAD(P)-dependent oxidoreductase [Muribaculaceae bacterium]
MNYALAGKWAVVTGADGGIGIEFCRALARRGCSLVMVSVTVDPLRRAAIDIENTFGVKAIPLTLDLTDQSAVSILAAFLSTKDVEADFVVNNAGIFSFRELVDTPDEKINCFIDLHVRATTMLSLYFARRFKQRGSGRILNMSSMSCWMPMPGLAMYASTKAYIRVFTRSLHYELKDYGATATVAAPGGIATSLFGLPDHLMRLAVAIGAVEKPDRFAEKAVKAMLKGKKQYINGFINRLAIFFVGITPTWVRMQVKRRLLDKGITK